MSSKTDYDFYKSIGICVRCHKRQVEPRRIMCYECMEKEREKCRSRHEKNIEIVRRRDLDKYYFLKQQGICTYCKHEKAIPGKTKCKKCLAKIKARRQAKRCDIDRSERRACGICYICGKNPVLPGKGVCEECYKVRQEAINKCLESREDGFNEYWKQENKLIFGGKTV